MNKVLSAFLESIRLFRMSLPPQKLKLLITPDLAPGYILTREAKKDTVLKIPKPVGQEGFTTLPILKGTMVCILALLFISTPLI